MNPFLRQPQAFQRTPLRAEQPDPKVTGSGVVAIRLYDPLDSWGDIWGVSAKEFVGVLDVLPDDTAEIRLLINSPGGDVWEGLAILNALRAHPAKVTAVVEGIAASAASFIAAGVDETLIAKNAEMFVHNAWGIALGNSQDMAKMAADLEHEDRNLASIYADKAGGTVDEWLAVMAAETTYSAEEAVEAGLADAVVDPKGDSGASKAKARFDLSIFNRSAQSARNSQTPVADSGGSTQERSPAVAFSDEQLTTLRQRVGVPEDADEATILAALDEALQEQAETQESTTITTQLPEGTVAIDAAQLAELQAAAQAGVQARRQQEAEERARIVDAAVADGRIPPARRDHWLAQLEADDGARDVLARLAPGLVPVAEQGHAGDGSGVGADGITDEDLDALASMLRVDKESLR